MFRKKLERQGLNALHRAMAEAPPAPEEAARAEKALSPAVLQAARRLEKKRAERRSLRLQAWALAGCCAAFAALAWLAYQNRAFLLAIPSRWGVLAGFFAVSILVAGCLPLILRKEGEKKDA
jgi:fatty acid desaturase